MSPCNHTTLNLYPLKGKLLTPQPTNHSSDPAESLFLAHETWGNGAAPSFMEALQSPQLISLFSFCLVDSSQRRKKMKVGGPVFNTTVQRDFKSTTAKLFFPNK